MGIVLGLLGLLALLVLLLAIPLDVTFQLEGIEAFNGQITIRWLFGLVRFRVRVPDITKLAPQSETRSPAANVQMKARRHGVRPNMLALLRQTAFRRRFYRFVKDLIRAAHLRQLRLQMRLGLGDPAATGCLWALIGPLNAAAQNLYNAQVQIEPEFIDPVFELQARGRVSLVPLQFLVLIIGFGLSPSSIRAWRTLNGSRA